jgi:predicted nucleic acid-binding protein
MQVVIADTSCLIIFEKLKGFSILRETFDSLVVTQAVADEFGPLPPGILVQDPASDVIFLRLQTSLGKGEASAIALALERPDHLLIMDERKGRKVAEEMGLKLIGSLGVLLKAKEKGVISSVKTQIDLIEQTNFRIAESVKKEILLQAGEAD